MEGPPETPITKEDEDEDLEEAPPVPTKKIKIKRRFTVPDSGKKKIQV